MRTRVIGWLALVSASTGPAAAQAVYSPPPAKARPATSGAVVGSVQTFRPAPKITTVDLVVTYLATPNVQTLVLLSPVGNFTCVPPGAVPPPFHVCRLAIPRGAATALQARWTPPAKGLGAAATTSTVLIAGQQWGGDCAGTPADVCQLKMTDTRNVTILPMASSSPGKP